MRLNIPDFKDVTERKKDSKKEKVIGKVWGKLLQEILTLAEGKKFSKEALDEFYKYLERCLVYSREYLDLNAKINNTDKTLLEFVIESQRCQPIVKSFVLSAAAGGDLDILKWLLEQRKIDKNTLRTLESCENKRNVLDVACQFGQWKVIKWLIEEEKIFLPRDLSVQNKNNEGRAPLHNTAVNGHINVLRQCLEQNYISKHDIRDLDKGEILLTDLCLFNAQFEILEFFFEQEIFTREDLSNRKYENSYNLAHWMGLSIHIEDNRIVAILDWLWNNKLIIAEMFQAKAGNGSTPIMFAATNANLGMMKWAIDKKLIDKETIFKMIHTPMYSKNRTTLLHELAYNPKIGPKKTITFLNWLYENKWITKESVQKRTVHGNTVWMLAGCEGKVQLFSWFYQKRLITRHEINNTQNNLGNTVRDLASANQSDFLPYYKTIFSNEELEGNLFLGSGYLWEGLSSCIRRVRVLPVDNDDEIAENMQIQIRYN